MFFAILKVKGAREEKKEKKRSSECYLAFKKSL